MNNSCIYKIKNLINGDEYIGSTLKGFEWRKSKHLRELENKNHHNRHLQNAYLKYGKLNFQFEIIEFINNLELLILREQYWISKLLPIYNVMKNIKSHIGVKRSIETRRKISNSLKGRKLSVDTKQKLRMINLGKKQTSFTIQKRNIKLSKPIIQLSKNGEFIKNWSSATEAANHLRIKRGVIYDCLNQRRPTYKSFIWKRK